jgi:hypothetical protein
MLLGMKTTLTLDDDLVATLERLRQEREASLDDVVNDVLRRGLKEVSARPAPRVPFRTTAVSLGRPLVPLDNVAEAIATLEGEDAK